MSNVYDEQFRRRISMHILVCDPASASIIHELRSYLEAAETELTQLRAERDKLRNWAEIDTFSHKPDCKCDRCVFLYDLPAPPKAADRSLEKGE